MDHLNNPTEKFVTGKKVFWWGVYNLMLCGACGLWIFARVQFFGETVSLNVPGQSYSRTR